MLHDETYTRREQTQVKHYILQHYLERFAHIVASRWDSITYVDGFAGPWNVRSPELRDSSFAIALEELRRARTTYGKKGRSIRLRCLFLEENPESYAQLHAFAEKIDDVEVRVLNGAFEESLGSILSFVRQGGSTFPFIFIDPTGWTGFGMKTISPLLRLNPGEILINFMTGHVRRFLHDERSHPGFVDLFGSPGFRERVEGLSGVDLDDALTAEYMANLRRRGEYPYVMPAIVLHPEIDRTHFHLIYATRHEKGVEVFKEAERRAMREMERVRAEAQRRKSEERTGQQSFLFQSEQPNESAHFLDLRERYLARAKGSVLRCLRERRRVSYDEVWLEALLGSPLVWEQDLKSWIANWREERLLVVEGLAKRERVPGRGRGHVLVFRQAISLS